MRPSSAGRGFEVGIATVLVALAVFVALPGGAGGQTTTTDPSATTTSTTTTTTSSPITTTTTPAETSTTTTTIEVPLSTTEPAVVAPPTFRAVTTTIRVATSLATTSTSRVPATTTTVRTATITSSTLPVDTTANDETRRKVVRIERLLVGIAALSALLGAVFAWHTSPRRRVRAAEQRALARTALIDEALAAGFIGTAVAFDDATANGLDAEPELPRPNPRPRPNDAPWED